MKIGTPLGGPERQPEEQCTDHIWCVIPVFNNKETVRRVALGCRAHVDNVLVIDDGSTDADVASLFADTDIAVRTHGRNRGKGRAILTGLEYVAARKARFMITIDGDGQHYPDDLERFVPLLQDDDALMIVGCRDMEAENVPGKSRFGRKVANFWLWVESGVALHDCQSGFRAYPVGYLSQLRFEGAHYEFETEVLAKAAWAGLELREVPINVHYPPDGERVTSFRPLIDNFRISLMHTKLVGRRLVPIPHRKLVASSEGQPRAG